LGSALGIIAAFVPLIEREAPFAQPLNHRQVIAATASVPAVEAAVAPATLIGGALPLV
jgi:hypothetical protein